MLGWHFPHRYVHVKSKHLIMVFTITITIIMIIIIVIVIMIMIIIVIIMIIPCIIQSLLITSNNTRHTKSFGKSFIQHEVFFIFEGLFIQLKHPSLNKQINCYIANLFPAGIYIFSHNLKMFDANCVHFPDDIF